MGNITCALKKLNYLNEDNTPNYDAVFQEIADMEIDENLKADLLDAMDMCKDFSTCLPVEKAKNPLVKEMGTAMGFIKCGTMKKIMACMKNDMRKYAEMGMTEGMDDMSGSIEDFMMFGSDFEMDMEM